MADWWVLIDSDGDPVSISSTDITSPPAGHTVKQFTSDGAPHVADWADPVAGETVKVARVWDRATAAWTTSITPTVVDRVLDDLASDATLVDVWQALTTTQRTVLRNRLGALLGRRRWRYANDPVDVED